MKDIKHIRRDFHLAAWVMPQGWDLGVPWGLGGIFFHPNSTRFGVWVTYMNATNNGTIFWVPAPWGLGERPKGQISLNLNYKSISKIFKPNFVHLLTNERYITYQAVFSFAPLDHARGGTWCYRGGLGVNFSLSKIQPDWVCELHEWHMQGHNFFGSPPPGALGRGQKFNFLNMVMWHIIFKGMSSRPGYSEKF